MKTILQIIGSFYLLILPGLIISFIAFKKISIINRVIISLALSISIVPLIILYTTKWLGMSFDLANIVMLIGLVIGLGGLIISKSVDN